MNFTITKVSDKNFTHFDGFKEMNFSNWEIVFNNTDNTLILQMRNGAPFPRKEVLATDVIIKNGIGGTPETFTTNAEIRARLIELGYNALVTSDPSGGEVNSVNGQTGTVVLDADDIAETSTRKWVSSTEKSTWNGKQDALTDVNFGSFANGLTAKTTLVDADLTNLVDSEDSNKAKKITWINVWNYIKSKADAIYEPIGGGGGSTLITPNTQTANYTLVLTDLDKIIQMDVATANNLTIPLNSSVAFSIGSIVYISQYGVGRTTIVSTGGVTIKSFNSWTKSNGQNSLMTLLKTGTDEWLLSGEINA